MKLAGCKAIITGASRGIGLGIAQVFARHGVSTVLLGRQIETLEVARKTLCVTSDTQKHRIHAIDVSKSDQWEQLSAVMANNSILVNAAGITHYSLLPRTPVQSIDSVLATNLTGAIYGSRAASKSMLKTGGCIINISSALAHRGGSGSSVYAASKAGLIGFTKALAEELGPRGVRCNAIAPGYIDTDMVAGMSTQMQSITIGKTAVKRIGTVEEVAQAALFIAENDFMNGSTITIDGGLVYE